jgi:hypothetical protein
MWISTDIEKAEDLQAVLMEILNGTHSVSSTASRPEATVYFYALMKEECTEKEAAP